MVAVRFGPPEKSNSISSRVEGDGDEISGGITNWLLDDLDTEEGEFICLKPRTISLGHGSFAYFCSQKSIC